MPEGFITYYAFSPMVGTGTKGDPRRVTPWVRIDMLVDLIDMGFICWDKNGAVTDSKGGYENDPIKDMGIIAVVRSTLREDIYNGFIQYHQGKFGYVVPMTPETGDHKADRAELKRQCVELRTLLGGKLQDQGFTLPAGDTLTDRITTFMADANIPAQLRPLRNYYLRILTGQQEGGMPPFLRRADGGAGVDPTKFANVRDALDSGSTPRQVKILHAMFEVAWLDHAVRNL